MISFLTIDIFTGGTSQSEDHRHGSSPSLVRRRRRTEEYADPPVRGRQPAHVRGERRAHGLLAVARHTAHARAAPQTQDVAAR